MLDRGETLSIRPPEEGWRRGALLFTSILFPLGLATLGALALLLTTLAEWLRARRSTGLWQRTPLDAVLALLILTFGLSAAFSPYRIVALEATLLLILLLALAYGTSTVLVSRSPAFVTPVLWALSAGSVLAALWGVSAYLFTGRPASAPGVGYNAAGTTLATGLPILLGAVVLARGRLRIAAAVGAACTLAGLAFTFARGAWLGGAVGLTLFLALVPRRARRPVWPTLGLLAVVLLAITGTAEALRERAETMSDPGVASDRVAMWRAGVAMVRDRPLLGSGLNTFGLAYPRYRLPEDPALGQPFAHNILLNIAVEGGLAALAAFLALLLAATRLGYRWLRHPERIERVRAATILSAAAALLAHQQLDGTAISFHIGFGLWMLIGIIAVRGAASPQGGAS